MPFARPTPFQAALDSTAVKRILPTSLKSAELSEIHASILERARFSAQTLNASYLTKMDEVIDRVLQPVEVIRAGERVTEGMGMIEAKRELESALKEIDYTPSKAGTIEDLGSDQRLNLVVDTNVRMAQGYGNHAQGMDPDVLDAFPAQELYRAEDRMVPREWLARWDEAGGEMFDGRMIALKTDPIWSDISAFGLPYPPFDFNSGMDVQDVDRQEAEDLGVMEPGQPVEPDQVGFNEDLQMSADQFGKSFLSQLKADLGSDYTVSKGVLRLKNRAPLIHAKFQGLPLSIETGKGEFRAGVDASGRPWSVLMPVDYGRILGTDAKSGGEHLNVYVGPHMNAPFAFVLEQMDPQTGLFDEPKAFLGFQNAAEAKAAYLGSFSDGLGRARMGTLASIPMRAFKSWVKGWSQRGRIVQSRFVRNDCGTGAGGFKPGNECGKSGGGEDPSGHGAAGISKSGPLTGEQLSGVNEIDHEQAVETLASRTPGFDNVSGSERQRIREEIRSNTKEYTPEALRDIAENVDHLHFVDQKGAEALSARGESFTGVAFYAQGDKLLVMTNGATDANDPRKVLSHELAHALDRRASGGDTSMGEHSATSKFMDAWEGELSHSSLPIGSYAASMPSEGFAEAVAYVHRHGIETARARIPMTTKYLEEAKVVKGGKGLKMQKNRKLKNAAAGEAPMKQVIVDGIAVDVMGDVDPVKLAEWVRKQIADAKKAK